MLQSELMAREILYIHGKLYSINGRGRITTLQDPPFTVTLTQLETLSQVAKGRSNKEIAASKGKKPKYVINQMENLRSANNDVPTISLIAHTVGMGLLHPHNL